MIFTGDLRQNLLIAAPSASDQELVNALVAVGLWQTFQSRAGLETYLGERGAAISGGEAARVAMARALLAKRPVLILDEPTANLDRATADLVMQEFLRLAKANRMAVLVISHDSELALSTASEVFVEKPRP